MQTTALDAIVLTGLFVLVGAIGILVVTALCATGRIRLNRFIGFRSNRTLESEKTWEAGHRAALPTVVSTASAAAVLALLGVLVPIPWLQAVTIGIGACALIGGGLLAQSQADKA